MQALMTVIITWLVVNFELPATDERPSVEFVPPIKMAVLRQELFQSNPKEGVLAVAQESAPYTTSQVVYAMYDARSHTIYLPERWAPDSPADVSILVHELVHHLQHVGALEYACSEARERLAYQAQARWLEIFGRTLATEFALDAMTIHLRTNCMH